MDFIPFNSRDTFYKSKFGAVKTGEKFRLRLFLPRSFSATAAYFMLRRDDGDFCEHKMCWAGMNGDDKEIWDIELSVPECGLYWYHFDYDSSWGAHIKRNAIIFCEDGNSGGAYFIGCIAVCRHSVASDKHRGNKPVFHNV